MTKALLRKQCLAQRQAMNKTTYRKLSQQIQERFFQYFNMSYYPYTHTYLACYERREADTWGIVRIVLQQHQGVVVAAPKLVGQPKQIQSYCIDTQTSFQQNAWGIQEPTNGDLVPPHTFHLVILPVIAFDEQGYRIGYGQGHYDRYLQQASPDATRVGLCFEDPVPVIQDINAQDVPLDFCVTPNQVFASNLLRR